MVIPYLKKSYLGLLILLLVCPTILVEPGAAQALAGRQSNGQEAALAAATSTMGPLSAQASDSSDPHARAITQPIGSTTNASLVAKRTNRSRGNPKSDSRKSRRAKGGKKIAPRVVIRPRSDLSPHGLIEGPQRYDPRPNYRTAGVRDPQTRDLIHDHFQELDRNRDGRIDPVERAFGRLDIDRDLSSRSLR